MIKFIYLQTSTFDDVNKLTEFIKSITGSEIETMKLDIDTQIFLTYSYVCIDREAWNVNKNFGKAAAGSACLVRGFFWH